MVLSREGLWMKLNSGTEVQRIYIYIGLNSFEKQEPEYL